MGAHHQRLAHAVMNPLHHRRFWNRRWWPCYHHRLKSNGTQNHWWCIFRTGGDQGFFPDRTPQTAGHRFRFTGPVWPVTCRNRLNSNLNSKNSVQPVRTGIPAGLTGLNSNPNLKSHVQPANRAVWPVYQVGLNGSSHFFSFLFLTLNARKVC